MSDNLQSRVKVDILPRKKLSMKKITYLILGFLSLGLGLIGIILPILPTVPFLLLASWLFYRSSEKSYLWLMNHPLFGKRLRQYERYRAVSAATKALGLTLLWVSLGLSIWLVKKPVVSVILPIVGIIGTIAIFSIRTLTREQQAEWTKIKNQPK